MHRSGFDVILALIAFAAHATAQKSAVLGIDLGSQFFKLAVVKTGGFDIVLNEASKRKSATAMSLINKERAFGDAAYAQKGRYPKGVVLGMQHLIGRSFDSKSHEKAGFGSYHLPYGFKKDEKRGTVIYDLDGTDYSPDEILGSLFNAMKDMSQKYIEQTVSECVITVPPYLTEHERRLIIDAANMVDLSVLMLVNDNTAVAVRYGIESKVPPGRTNNVLFVDVGASHTTATIATYEERNITSYKKVPSVQIQAVKWALIGGSAMDAVLTNHFADNFDKKHKKKIRENIKAITKLRKEAEKIKGVLSANKETMLMVESLMDDVDFKDKIKRTDFEELCTDIFTSIEGVIKSAIEASGLKLDEIHQVIPFGAGTRVPKIKELVLKATDRKQWQPSINTDEASALGAAFVAANFSKSFRLREFHVYDQFQFSVGIDVNGKKATLFKPQSVMEAKKTITQPLSEESKKSDTIKVTLSYDDAKLLPAGTSTGLATSTITGMKAAMEKLNVTGTPKVAMAVALHRDAIVEVVHAYLKVHSMDWVKKQRFLKRNVTEEVSIRVPLNASNATNASAGNDTAVSEKAEEQEKKDSADTLDTNTTAPNASNKTEKESVKTNYTTMLKNVTREKTVEVVEDKLEKKLHTIALNVTRKHEGVPMLDDAAFKAAQARNEKFKAEEKERNARAGAKNDVEAWIFTSRDKLSAEGMDQISTEEERTKVSTTLENAENWLWEDGDNVAVKVYSDKKAELAEAVRDMFYRHQQFVDRPPAIKNFKDVIADALKRAGEWAVREEKRMARNDTTWIHHNETNRLIKLCNESSQWLAEKEADLKKSGLMVKPPFSVNELTQHIRPVENEVSYLRYKPKPASKKKPSAKKNSTANSSVKNGTASNTTANSTGNKTNEESKKGGKDPILDGAGHEEL